MNSTSSHRNTGLDVMRSLAIMLVLFSHGAKFLPQAWIVAHPDGVWAPGVLGVELFYGLSGFLIGNLLLDIQQAGGGLPLLGRYFVRRWMRTLPLYYLVLAALWLFPALDPAQRFHTWTYLVFAQNLLHPMQGIWYGPSWSLVIEEWSYLLLPLLVFGFFRQTRHSLAISCVCVCIAAIVLRLVLSDPAQPWDGALRKVAIMRVDALAYGGLAACLARACDKEKLKTALLLFMPVALICIAAAMLACNDQTSDPHWLLGKYGRHLLFPTLGASVASLVLLARYCPDFRLQRVTGFIAKISYALYLVHWPFLFLLDGPRSDLRFAYFSLATFASAICLSYLVEQPIMRLRPRQFAMVEPS